MDPQSLDWDSESDSDNEELLDVRTADNVSFGGKHSCSNTCTNDRMDPKDLPEHLQPLMEGLAEDITFREREEMVAAIYKYRDVVRRGDMGRTVLVTDTIDTGEHRLIRLPPR